MEQRELISKLFSWTHTLNLLNAQNEVVMQVYQRLVGDLDIQKARLFALRCSRELRMKFRNTETDEYIALVSPVDDLADNRDSLITLLLVDSVGEVKQELDRTFYFPEPTEPTEFSTTEEHEEYAKKWEEWEDSRNLAYSKDLVQRMDARKAELDKLDTNELLVRAKNMRIEALCEQELKARFIEMCVILGTYIDEKFEKHLFSSYQEYATQTDILKNQLLEGYAELEMSTVSLKESTKSQASEQESS